MNRFELIKSRWEEEGKPDGDKAWLINAVSIIVGAYNKLKAECNGVAKKALEEINL
jgi:hypothetical protein